MKTGGEEDRWDWSEVEVYESGRKELCGGEEWLGAVVVGSLWCEEGPFENDRASCGSEQEDWEPWR